MSNPEVHNRFNLKGVNFLTELTSSASHLSKFCVEDCSKTACVASKATVLVTNSNGETENNQRAVQLVSYKTTNDMMTVGWKFQNKKFSSDSKEHRAF